MVKHNVQELIFAARSAYVEARDTMAELRAGKGERGLAEMTAECVAHVRGVSVALMIESTWDEEALPALSRLQLLHIIQEALTNVRRHAAANHVSVHLMVETGHAHIRVEDDGCGFCLSRFLPELLDPVYYPRSEFHRGLSAMRRRARAVGGTFRIESSPGRGTRVIVWIPMNQSEAV